VPQFALRVVEFSPAAATDKATQLFISQIAVEIGLAGDFFEQCIGIRCSTTGVQCTP
jgi:hypothetical protein